MADKDEQLDPHRATGDGALTTNQGLRVSTTDDSLKAGPRGPTLLEDFHFREKLTHFDHERIPERVVHARGSGAYGHFQLYRSLADHTCAGFLTDPSRKTPVFVRFSTVVGFRGSADTVRDVRGFATKFYTDEGNFDLVGNNMPVFFIQDAIKFPDLVHAIKPEPHHEMPQASAAHDTFWDFIALTPETMHMIMWVLSDRAIPRSYRMMEGFGVHTFRLVNGAGKAHFVKFHWKPALGTHGLVWDEAQKIAGKDPDFNRRDLWQAIAGGNFPEFELGLQIVPEEAEHDFGFDLLDPTKIIPEEEVPVELVGRMVLDRNPDNFFAETEQVAFHPGHLVPGIDFTNDPLLQGRLFSYLDTQLIRLGGPNFAEIPVNRPVATVRNNQRDGYGRQRIDVGRTAYSPNSLGGGCPAVSAWAEGGFQHYAERVDGRKIAARSDSFADHFSQATLFWNSLSDAEKDHLVEAAHFELGKVDAMDVRERMVGRFNEVDHELARRVAEGIGVTPPRSGAGRNHGRRSAAITMDGRPPQGVRTRKVAALLAPGFSPDDLGVVARALEEEGAQVEVVAAAGGTVAGDDGTAVAVDKTFLTTGSVVFDAVFVPGGAKGAAALMERGEPLHFLAEAYRHGKAIGAAGAALELLRGLQAVAGFKVADPDGTAMTDAGVVTAPTADKDFVARFLTAIAAHRHWDRPRKDQVPA